ncbi:hypothetical protein EV702DRAFT_1042394 [Suillus placidus]|uniref:Uncharacterized protein n=1 Tax=Suillus placidus TaxID=48579 RepID=A0A9P7A2H2_9AGAM|nr:hypothetical protein EV702DRAFT_1042394 [Suillus placidus]
MTYASNDPFWWPTINFAIGYSCYAVVSFTVMVYDWALTSGQEVLQVDEFTREAISLSMSSRLRNWCYTITIKPSLTGSAIMLWLIPTVSVNDAGCNILWYLINWTPVVVTVILGGVMILRLHAMYLGSRKILIFLVIILLTLTITTGVLLAIVQGYTRSEEFVLSGTYHCVSYFTEGNTPLLIGSDWEYVIGLAWEVIALSFAVWIAVKHFCELRRQSKWSVRDCFTVLIKTHVLYFAAFAVTSVFTLGGLSYNQSNPSSVGLQIYYGVDQIVIAVQLFVLGPRLILSVRAHHARLLADSDEGIAMTTIAFQEHIHESNGSDGYFGEGIVVHDMCGREVEGAWKK